MKHVLVTGANGFIASHTVEKLLARGDAVTGTVRDASSAEKTAHLLAMEGADARLTLVSADFQKDAPFTAHADVDAILHMASPYTLKVRDPQRDLVDPAIKGTLAALRAADAQERVKRVVITSSMAAITDEPDGRVLTEADWNEKSTLNRNPYYYSKTQAERAAWAFMAERERHFDLVVINPFLVIGPSHTPVINTSVQVFADLVTGGYPAIMDLTWGIVDVRDVAEAHIAALGAPDADGRYICASGLLSMGDAVELLREWGHGGKLPALDLSGGFGTRLMRFASRTQGSGVGSYLRSHLGGVPRFDNSKIRNDLGIDFRKPGEALRATMDDLLRWGHIPQRNGSGH